jgi:chromosome segregation ATPase
LACLEAELREKEEMLQQRNAALEDLEKGFMARAQDMEILIQRRDDLLEKRETEFREALNKQKKQTAVLEAQLGEKEEQLSQKDSAYRESQEGLGARISDLEGEIRRKGELLESREAEIADLQSRINALAVSSEGDGQRRERNTAVVEEVERGLEDGSYLDDPSEEEAEDFEPGVREESKVRLIGQSMRNVMVKPGNIARIGPLPDARKSRLVSLLAPIKKGS